MAKADDHIIATQDCQSVLQRDDSYRANTPRQSWMKTEEVEWQAHHILCNHSVTKANIAKAIPQSDLPFAEAVLWITPWDLNDGHNMMGMPTNWQYRDNDGKIPVNIPSHQVDHNTDDGYTDECTDWLKTHVWDKIKDKGKDHKANATNMRELLRGGSEHFRIQLGKRGVRPGTKGTAYCWDRRFKAPPPNATAAEKAAYKHEPKWYFPFSMAVDEHVNERAPGIDWKTTQAALGEILKKVG